MILKERGEEKAREIVRRHRLTERLLYKIFEMFEEEVEEEACKLEHILSPAVTESVCTFLGHPPTCIHGKPRDCSGQCPQDAPKKPFLCLTDWRDNPCVG